MTFSQRTAHFFHVVSNIRPLVWIGLYICAAPLFALIYWLLPADQFRVPDGETLGFGGCMYYSVVTITTLGFGDFTPAHGGAQALTAIEVMCGLIFLGLFLNAVGSMKSEIDVESEIEKQKALHNAMETRKLIKSVPMVYDTLNTFLAYCYAVSTPPDKRTSETAKYNPDFTFRDLSAMFEPSGLPFDRTNLPAVERLMASASKTSLMLDSLQQRVDLTLWPKLLEYCFSFVANFQMFSNANSMFHNPEHIVVASGLSEKEAEKYLSQKIAGWEPEQDLNVDPDLKALADLYNFIKGNAAIAMEIETLISQLSLLNGENN